MISRPTSSPVTHNVGLQQFETQAGDGSLAFLTYSFEGRNVAFDHTFVPEELRGRGIAASLVRAALQEARLQGWRVLPRCSYVAGFMERHPEFADLMGEDPRP